MIFFETRRTSEPSCWINAGFEANEKTSLKTSKRGEEFLFEIVGSAEEFLQFYKSIIRVQTKSTFQNLVEQQQQGRQRGRQQQQQQQQQQNWRRDLEAYRERPKQASVQRMEPVRAHKWKFAMLLLPMLLAPPKIASSLRS
jgi:hypothetical protein